MTSQPHGRPRHEDKARAADAAAVRARLRTIYWIGGGSGGGKSTIARLVATRNDMAVYSTDAVMADHAARLTPEDAPQLSRFKGMSMDQRWVNRSPEVMLNTFHWFRGEGFGLIIKDLLEMAEKPVIAEGFRLLPSLVGPLLANPSHAVWLLPTPSFRWAAFNSRGTAWEIPNQTSDPHRAQNNLLERDRMFTDRLAAETTRLNLPAIDVDTTVGEGDLVERVTRIFGL